MDEWLLRTDLCVIGAYLLVMLAIGWRVTDGARDVEGYTVGNRSLGSFALGFSVLGTFLSSITFLGLPATVFKEQNWSTFAFGAAIPFAALVAVLAFIPLYRNRVGLSAYEFLDQRFGYWARAYAALCYVTLQIIRVAMVTLLVALAIKPLMGWSVVTTVLVLGVIVIIYDILGGIKAVIWTDVLQVFVLVGGALWCLAEIGARRPGGLSQLLQDVPAGGMSTGPLISTDLVQGTFLVIFLYGLSENLRNYGTDQNYIQRMLCARGDREASRSIWIGALGYLPLNVLFCFLGTALFVLYRVPIEGGELAATLNMPLPEGAAADEVFPHFLRYELSPIARGTVIAGILAAAMSTVDSCLNSTSLVLLVDLVRPWRRNPGKIPEILLLRGFTALIGCVGCALAVGLYTWKADQSRTLMQDWWSYAGVAGSGLFGLFLLAWLMPRVPSWGALVAVVGSLPVLIWGVAFREHSRQYLHPNLIGVAGFLLMLIVGGVVALGVKQGMIPPNRRWTDPDRGT